MFEKEKENYTHSEMKSEVYRALINKQNDMYEEKDINLYFFYGVFWGIWIGIIIAGLFIF